MQTALRGLAVVDRDADAGGDDRRPAAAALIDLLARARAIGRLGIRISWSLPKAMFEPQKETEPTIAANSDGITNVELEVVAKPSVSWRNSDQAISATAPPPTPLNSATICGIAVIFTWRADGDADGRADRRGRAMIRPQLPIPSGRAASRRRAIAMPTAAMRLPRTAVRGPVSPHQPEDEQARTRRCRGRDEVGLLDEGRGERQAHVPASSASCLGAGLRLEHLEHPVGDQEAADDVDRAEGDRDRRGSTLSSALRSSAEPEHEQAAEHDDAVDRVGARHQRRVQRVRHLRDHREADEAGQDEDRELGDEHQVASAAASPRGLGALVDDLAVARDAGAGDDLVVEVEASASPSSSISSSSSVCDVLRVELRGVLGHLRRQVQRASDRDAVLDDGLAGLGQLAVAAGLAGEVDDHRCRASCPRPPRR